jgi:hypothetical protein
MTKALQGVDRPSAGASSRVGVSGVVHYNGYLEVREKSPNLRGTQRYVTFTDVLVNTSIVAAGVRFFLAMVAKAGWKARANPKGGAKAEEVAELVEEILKDTKTPWHRIVRRAAMYKFYGFNVQEWIAKRRPDGVIGLANVEVRPQSTIERWDLDPAGQVLGVTQRDPQSGRELYIPRRKIIHVVDDALDDGPEGIGLLRHVVEPARRLARIEQLEGFGYEMDLRGIPIGRAPFAALEEAVKNGRLTAVERDQILQPMKDFMENHIRSPRLGIMMDSLSYTSSDEAQTPSAIRQWDMELLNSGTTALPDAARTIQRMNTEIAVLLGVENLLVGTRGDGSLALSRDKSSTLGMVVDSVLKELTESFRSDILVPLQMLNGWREEDLPELYTEAIQYREVGEITAALREMATAGAVLAPDDPAINEVRHLLGLSDAVVLDLSDEAGLAGGEVDPDEPLDDEEDDEETGDPAPSGKDEDE